MTLCMKYMYLSCVCLYAEATAIFHESIHDDRPNEEPKIFNHLSLY